MFSRFLYVLKKIEDGECDAHQGAFTIGKMLKDIYIDSALRKADACAPAGSDAEPVETYVKPREISWRDFKRGAHLAAGGETEGASTEPAAASE
jgi:hypothetical protein